MKIYNMKDKNTRDTNNKRNQVKYSHNSDSHHRAMFSMKLNIQKLSNRKKTGEIL